MSRPAVGVVTAAALVCALSGGPAQATRNSLVQRIAYLMGTRAELSVWAPNRTAGLLRLDRALQVLEETDAQISTWREDSPMSQLNRSPSGVPWQANRSLCELMRVVADWHAETAGAFDPAIGPLIDAWDLRGPGRLPSGDTVARARAASGMRHFDLDAATCRVTRRGGAWIDTGAFGKGEALDRAARALRGLPWIIDLGGQLSAGAPPPGSTGWPVAIAHPANRSEPVLNVRISHGSLATSGGAERDLLVGQTRVGHILDPRTGVPARFAGSVTVWHEQGLAADILSTALFVMGPGAGLRWAGTRGIAALFLDVDTAGRVTARMTPRFRPLIAHELEPSTVMVESPGVPTID